MAARITRRGWIKRGAGKGQGVGVGGAGTHLGDEEQVVEGGPVGGRLDHGHGLPSDALHRAHRLARTLCAHHHTLKLA